MPLKQKQFIPFMIVVAAVTVAIIIFSSFNFTNKQAVKFQQTVAKSDSLHIMPLTVVGSQEVVTIEEQFGANTILVFWASWSEKSNSLLEEIQNFKAETDSLNVIAAMVKDAEESLPSEKLYADFMYVDGIRLYNYLRVPGFPSYILFDEEGDILHTHIGYQKGAGFDTLKTYLQ